MTPPSRSGCPEPHDEDFFLIERLTWENSMVLGEEITREKPASFPLVAELCSQPAPLPGAPQTQGTGSEQERDA